MPFRCHPWHAAPGPVGSSRPHGVTEGTVHGMREGGTFPDLHALTSSTPFDDSPEGIGSMWTHYGALSSR
jgi:hypothetical protein